MGFLNRLKPNLPNLIHVPGTWMFIVRTQAGFRKACKIYEDGDFKMEVDNYPTSYPALISLSTGYRGYTYISVSWVHINVLKKLLKDM